MGFSEEKDLEHRKLDNPVTFATLKQQGESKQGEKDESSIWLTKKDEGKTVSSDGHRSRSYFDYEQIIIPRVKGCNIQILVTCH